MVGETLAHYEILEKLGSGGMGDVYRGYDPVLRSEVALRSIHSAPGRSERVFARDDRRDTALAEVLVGVSYRLTSETGEHLLGEFAEAADDLRAAGMRFVFPS